MYKKGTIVLVPFPFTDLSGQKVRPAIIISNQSKSTDVIVLFITTQTKTKFPYTVPAVPSNKNGLKASSLIICNKIATLDRAVILGELGEIESDTFCKIETEIKKVLGLV